MRVASNQICIYNAALILPGTMNHFRDCVWMVLKNKQHRHRHRHTHSVSKTYADQTEGKTFRENIEKEPYKSLFSQ